MTNWPGLGYAPVEAVTARLQARQHRKVRRRMLRFFFERGLGEFYARMIWLRDHSGLSGAEKLYRYRETEIDYIDSIAKPAATEAAAPEAGGTVVLLDAEKVAIPADNGRERADAEVGVPDMEEADADGGAGMEAEILGDA